MDPAANLITILHTAVASGKIAHEISAAPGDFKRYCKKLEAVISLHRLVKASIPKSKDGESAEFEALRKADLLLSAHIIGAKDLLQKFYGKWPTLSGKADKGSSFMCYFCAIVKRQLRRLSSSARFVLKKETIKGILQDVLEADQLLHEVLTWTSLQKLGEQSGGIAEHLRAIKCSVEKHGNALTARINCLPSDILEKAKILYGLPNSKKRRKRSGKPIQKHQKNRTKTKVKTSISPKPGATALVDSGPFCSRPKDNVKTTSVLFVDNQADEGKGGGAGKDSDDGLTGSEYTHAETNTSKDAGGGADDHTDGHTDAATDSDGYMEPETNIDTGPLRLLLGLAQKDFQPPSKVEPSVLGGSYAYWMIALQG